MGRKKLSIVIPVLDEQKMIVNLLTDIAQQTHLPQNSTVVDAMSKDKTILFFKKNTKIISISSTRNHCKFNKKVVFQRNLGANNTNTKLSILLQKIY